MKKISIVTLGCKTNQFESEAILDRFVKHDFVLCDLNEKPDVVLINTCCVTNRAEYKSRYAFRKALKSIRPEGKVVVTGCYVDKGSSFFESKPDNVFLFSNTEKHHIFNRMTGEDADGYDDFLEFSTDSYYLHTRVPVKVQDGCNFFCSYCILPYVRGKPVSRSMDSIIDQVTHLAEKGTKEIILTGINLGLYGIDKKDLSLLDLLKNLVQTDISQIRLSSLEPMFFNDQMIDFLASQKKICPHFHIPLQNGSDRILTNMNRTYTTCEFSGIIHNVKSALPDAAIGCDVILGFPGETEDDFDTTYAFIENLPIAYLHVFRYSPRKFTKGMKMKGEVNGSVSKKRMQSLQKLGQYKKNEYSKYIIEKKVPMRAVLEMREQGNWSSVSDHYVRIFLKDKKCTAANGMLKTVIARRMTPNDEGLIVEEYHD